MTAQSFSPPSQRTLYRVDLVVPSPSPTAGALPPSTAVIDAPPPTTGALEGAPPVFDLDDAQPLAPIDLAPLDLPPLDHPLYQREQRAAWLAAELLKRGSVFHGTLDGLDPRGINLRGAKGRWVKKSGENPAEATSAAFTSVIGLMLRESSRVEEICLPAELVAEATVEGLNSLAHQKVEQGGLLLAGLFQHYWRAVATAFSEAWDAPDEYLLWHRHGLTAFARLGGLVVSDQVAAYDIRQHYFDEVLERIATTVSLAKADHADVPARRLPTHLFETLAAARHMTGARRPSLMAVPGGVSDINWGSAPPPVSPWVGSIGSVGTATSVPFAPED